MFNLVRVRASSPRRNPSKNLKSENRVAPNKKLSPSNWFLYFLTT